MLICQDIIYIDHIANNQHRSINANLKHLLTYCCELRMIYIQLYSLFH